ncbi:MAG: TonB-dependent receptor, partial [Thermoanaerobaculia bacterium]
MQPSSRILCVLLISCFAVASTAPAQEGQGRIEGRVTRESGEGMGAVAVVVDQIGAATLTDARGNYRFSNVPVGTYSLSFTLGDHVATRSDVVVAAGSSQQVDVTVDWQVSFAETITVVSASRRAERIVEAPAAVTLVTAEEIERQASHGQLPKLLEFTPGAEVTQSGVYDYNLNTRGFNSSLTRRVATLIDGRDPSVPFLGAQEWAGIGFPLDDLASLELVRGPSAALYGANASSGVLNMITRAPRDSQEGLLRLTAGELSTVNADFRWAGELGSDWYVKLLGGARTSGDFTISRRGAAEYSRPCQFTGDTQCLPQESVRLDPEDDDEIFFGSLRLDKHFSNGSVFTIEGGQTEIEGPTFQTGIGRVQLVDVERPWARANFNTVHWNVLGYFTKRDAAKQTALASGGNIVLDTERVTLEVQTNWDLGAKARIVVGGSFTDEDIDSADAATGRQTLLFEPIENEKEALFAQLDWNAGSNVRIVLAGRLDESDLHDSQFSPKAAIVYSINPNNTLRFTYNEAFQVANYSEFFLQVDVAAPITALAPIEGICLLGGVSCGLDQPVRVLGLGNKDLELEEVKTIEVGYSGILGGKAFLTIDYYTSDNENFITDLLPQLGTAAGRINPNFGPYQPPADLGEPFRSLLLGTLQGALGPS